MKKVLLIVLFVSSVSAQSGSSLSQSAVGTFIFGAMSTVAAVAIMEGVPYVVQKVKNLMGVQQKAALSDEWVGPLPDEIERLCEFHVRHTYYRAFNLTPPRGYLLYGPPGTGKTLLAESLAKKLHIPLIKETSGKFLDRWQGSGVLRLSALIEQAQRCKRKRGQFKCIVFIDEIDGICSREEQYNREELRLAEQLLTVIAASENKEILFVGATNLLNTVDPAFTRPGRLIPVFIGYPNSVAREAIFKAYLKKHRVNYEGLDLSAFVQKTEGFSPAAIRHSIEQGLYRHLRDSTVPFGVCLQQVIMKG